MPIYAQHHCGIYEIRCLVSGKVYVGSSKNVPGRLYKHRWQLRKGQHYNLHLQRAWDLYGEESFTFKKVSDCALTAQFEEEQRRFALYTWDFLYNTSREARQGGTRTGQTQSEKTKQKIGDANRGRASWNKGGVNTWATEAASARVEHYPNLLVAEHLDGRVLQFTHEAEAARQLGYKRKRINESLRRSTRLTTGWKFCWMPKGVCHPNL